MSDGHPSIAPSISRDTLIRLGREGWSASQMRHCLEMLDDTGVRLLAVFGDPRCTARVDGAWVIVIADLVVPAEPLRRCYRALGSAVHGTGCPIDGLIADALLLAATTGVLTTDRISAMAEKLAPAVWEGFDSREAAEKRMAQQVCRLLDRGLLAEARNSDRSPAWRLTSRGSSLAAGVVRARWESLAVASAPGSSLLVASSHRRPSGALHSMKFHSQGDQMTEREMAEHFAKFLAEEGFFPNVDDENDVVFKYEGRTYFVQVDAKDPEFFRLIYPNFWPIESDSERQTAALVASEVNRGLKTAKVFLIDDDTWATIELFCSPIDNYRSVFKRSLGALQAAVKRFSDGMRAAQGDQS